MDIDNIDWGRQPTTDRPVREQMKSGIEMTELPEHVSSLPIMVEGILSTDLIEKVTIGPVMATIEGVRIQAELHYLAEGTATIPVVLEGKDGLTVEGGSDPVHCRYDTAGIMLSATRPTSRVGLDLD